MKTIFLAVELGAAVRNILRTQVLSKLLDGDNQVIILSPFFDSGILDEFKYSNVICEDLEPYRFTLYEQIMVTISKAVFDKLNSTFTRRINLIRQKKNHSIRYWIRLILKLIPANSNILKWLDEKIVSSPLNNQIKLENLFNKYSPNIIVCTYAFLYDYEFPLIKYARQKGVPVVAINLSWDNITSKGKVPTKIDRFIVWNEIQKKELMDMYPYYTNEDIYIAGIPQYDYYHTDHSIIWSREIFFDQLGLDSTKKLITYTTSSHHLAPYENEIIEDLANLLPSRVNYPAQLLVRKAPRDSWEYYSNIRQRQDIHFIEAGVQNQYTVDQWNPQHKDMVIYSNLLYHSDVIINTASTVTLDSATFDTPIINIGYDGHHHKTLPFSVKRFYLQEHYRNVVETGGIRIAYNIDELINYINIYLGDPTIDKEGRYRIIKTQCYKLDGKACERIANFILDKC